MPKRHYTIFCDESSKRGDLFSNFYGGALVRSDERQAIEESLASKKEELNLYGEIKWTKITEAYREKYIEFIEHYFSLIESDRIRIRIMFTQNIHDPNRLNQNQRENQYFLLYYQMIKHSFGITYCNPSNIDRVFFSIILDEIPHNKEKYQNFKSFISKIERTSILRGKNIFIPTDQIASVDSKSHNILQGLDIILGAMQFRLNKQHLIKPEGSRIRGKRTRAKEAVYKSIQTQIHQRIYPRFNIGITTGTPNGKRDRWNHRYRHWRFESKRFS